MKYDFFSEERWRKNDGVILLTGKYFGFINFSFSILADMRYNFVMDKIDPTGPKSLSKQDRTEWAKGEAKRKYLYIRARERSPSYIQSRHFHKDQFLRDVFGSKQPWFLHSAANGSPQIQGSSARFIVNNDEACRLTNSYCGHDNQCCSGKCRCVRWTVLGKTSCWKKCF